MITNKIGRTAQWGRLFIILASLILCIGLGATQAFAAAPYVPQFSYNNNLTINDGTGTATGGANDILVYWDGTLKTSVSTTAQVINGYINAKTNNGGFVQTCKTGTSNTAWKSHDVAIYGPGTYTVFGSCLPGSPACAGGTNPINFTVGTGEVGLHMLVDWGAVASDKNIDVVNVWTPGVFGPSAMWTGACGANAANTVWDKMSKDPGTGHNGYPMVDGPFVGTTWNFNMVGPSINRPIDTNNNNFTMLDLDGAFIGGTNDVHFTWDGTMKTAVTCPSVSNATISSWCSFFGTGKTWAAHDVNIYGPGTYTIYDACNPGCANDPTCTNASGVNNPITFTVASGQIAGHMLFFWNGNDNIDVVDIWQPKTVFAPKGLMDNITNFIYGCGTNPASTVWDWMSSDWGSPDGAGGVLQVPNLINGAPMTDGPFGGSYANFNVMGYLCTAPTGTFALCDDGNVCTTDTFNPNVAHNVSATCPCVHTNNTLACDDGNICNGTDTCSGGTCSVHTGINPCVNPTPICSGNLCIGCDLTHPCTALDQCHVAGTCTAGVCSNPPAADGTNCNDGNACTQTDTCQAGVCTGVSPVTCTALDQCHVAGACNTATGVCTNPNAADGTSCNDNNACTTTDVCTNGSCHGTAVACAAPATCKAAGVCNTSTGVCSYANAADGAACDDGNACTTPDVCTSGACTGGPAPNCDDNDLCTTDTCNTSTGCVHAAVVCTVAGTVCDTATGSCVSRGGDIVPPAGVNLADALFALRIAAGLETPTAAQLLAGDVAPCVNGQSAPDGVINMGDVIVILRKALGLPTCI